MFEDITNSNYHRSNLLNWNQKLKLLKVFNILFLYFSLLSVLECKFPQSKARHKCSIYTVDFFKAFANLQTNLFNLVRDYFAMFRYYWKLLVTSYVKQYKMFSRVLLDDGNGFWWNRHEEQCQPGENPVEYASNEAYYTIRKKRIAAIVFWIFIKRDRRRHKKRAILWLMGSQRGDNL